MVDRARMFERAPSDAAAVVRAAVTALGRPERPPVPAVLLGPATLGRVVPHARVHKAEGCVHQALEGRVEGAAVAELAAARRAAHLQHLRCVHFVRTLSELLADDGVTMLVFKGPVLAGRMYGDGGLRTSLDLDVLVPRRDFGRAIARLEGAGYQLIYRNWPFLWNARAGELPLGGGPVTLDAHWHLMMGEYDRRWFSLEPEPFLERAREVEVGGVTMRTFDAVDTLLHVALHATHSGGTRLMHLKDVERCLAVEAVDPDELVRRARATRTHLAVGIALARARRTVDAAVPDGLPEALAGRSTLALDALATRACAVERSLDRATPAAWLGRSMMGSRRGSVARFGGMAAHWTRNLRNPDRHLDEHDPVRADAPTRPLGEPEVRERYFRWVASG